MPKRKAEGDEVKSAKKYVTENDLKKTYFVPKARMEDVLDHMNAPSAAKPALRCDYNILDLKHERSTRNFFDENVQRYCSARHRTLFVSACYKALYAHDWDRLLYILKRFPRWRFKSLNTFHMRMLTILLMYHPESQVKGYFNEYLHMVWGCRSDQDKKAIQKVILTLPKRMYHSIYYEMFMEKHQQSRKEAFEAAEERRMEREMNS